MHDLETSYETYKSMLRSRISHVVKLPFYETTTILMVTSLTSKNGEDLFHSEGQKYRSDRNPGIKTLHWGGIGFFSTHSSNFTKNFPRD